MKKKPITIDDIAKSLRDNAEEFFLGQATDGGDAVVASFREEAKEWHEEGEIITFRVNNKKGIVLTLVRHDDTYRLNRHFMISPEWVTSVDIEAHSLEDLAVKLINKL